MTRSSRRQPWPRIAILIGGVAGASPASAPAFAQSAAGSPDVAPFAYVGGMQPVMDDATYTHVLVEQAEDRWNGRDQQFRYDAQAWAGNDYDKLWLKSEGIATSRGTFEDGQHEALYDRAMSSYFDVQAGLRVDLDDRTTRYWAALGVQGLSLYDVELEATVYASDDAHYAARLKVSTDFAITDRLILQPEVELNAYTKADPGRDIGSGVSDIDTGLRLRYEITRKLAPYLGVSYAGLFGQSGRDARRAGENSSRVSFTIGIRSWF